MQPHYCPNLDLWHWPEQGSRGFVSWADWRTVYGGNLWQAWRHYWHSGAGLPREEALAVVHDARMRRHECHQYSGLIYCYCHCDWGHINSVCQRMRAADGQP